VENCDAGSSGADRGGRARRLQFGPAGPARGHPRDRVESALCDRDIRPTRTEADKYRLLRAHVGALRPMDVAVDVRRCRPKRTRRRGRFVDRLHRVCRHRSRGGSRMPSGRLGIRPFRSASGGGSGAADQWNLLRGISNILRRPDNRSRRLSLGMGCCRHRRLGRLLHRTQRDDGHPVRRHRPNRADRHRFPVNRCHHPTRPHRRRADRLAIRVPASCTRPPDRCRGDVGPTCSSTPPTPQGGKR